MKQLARFLVGLFMPFFLIIGGGALVGWGIGNEWNIIAGIGATMVVAGILWGLFLFLWCGTCLADECLLQKRFNVFFRHILDRLQLEVSSHFTSAFKVTRRIIK